MRSDSKNARVIVALDTGSSDDAIHMVERLEGIAGMFKVGLELFVSQGPDIVREIVARGERVFLDLKLHDIPNTVSRAALEAAGLGVSMMTLHSSGGPTMIRATRDCLEAACGAERPLILAVTVLTSLSDGDLAATGVSRTAGEQVLSLAEMAASAGADGCVCSPVEVSSLRDRLGASARIVTPGVRMLGQPAGDQARIASPGQALADGADWIVVGRYVNQAADPREALLEVIESLQ